MKHHTPKQPASLSKLALAILERIKDEDWADHLVLGGGVALSHYLEYRETHDADLWWTPGTSEGKQKEILKKLEEVVLSEAKTFFGEAEISTRTWGETSSIEVKNAKNKKVFSWQISSRTKQLEPYLSSPYGKVKIESLNDNLASKMTALVSRGTPRDFMDIFTAIDRGLTSWEECWKLWEQKNPNLQRKKAELSILHSLESIKARRPLSSIPAPKRSQAKKLRKFFEENIKPVDDPGEIS